MTAIAPALPVAMAVAASTVVIIGIRIKKLCDALSELGFHKENLLRHLAGDGDPRITAVLDAKQALIADTTQLKADIASVQADLREMELALKSDVIKLDCMLFNDQRDLAGTVRHLERQTSCGDVHGDEFNFNTEAERRLKLNIVASQEQLDAKKAELAGHMKNVSLVSVLACFV